jgi:hypothetical protein
LTVTAVSFLDKLILNGAKYDEVKYNHLVRGAYFGERGM